MGIRIRDWPKPPDPREAHFAIRGTDCLGAGPWKWLIKCPSADHYIHGLARGVVVENVAASDSGATWEYVEHMFIFPKFRIQTSGFNPDAGFDPGATLNLSLDIITQPFSGFYELATMGRIHLNEVSHAIVPIEYGLEIPWTFSGVLVKPMPWDTPLGYQ